MDWHWRKRNKLYRSCAHGKRDASSARISLESGGGWRDGKHEPCMIHMAVVVVAGRVAVWQAVGDWSEAVGHLQDHTVHVVS